MKNELNLLESGLVSIYEHQDNSERLCDAKELYDFLEVDTRYNDWIGRKIKKYKFEDGVDFYSILSKSNGGRPSVEYYLKVDTAKEIAMVENNERGRQIRKYFIEVEKRFNKQNAMKPMTNLQMMQNMINQMVEQEQQMLAINNKVEHLESEFYKETVEEGFMSNDNIARKLGLYSMSDKPHFGFVDAIAKQLRIYNTNVGYKDEYVNVVRTVLYGGTVGVVVYYSDKAYELISKYLDEKFYPEVEQYKRGSNKGNFKESYYDLNDKTYKFNEDTYNRYKD